MATPEARPPELGIAGSIAKAFINSKLTPLIILFAIGIGAFATLQLPREEEPQIIVPMVDVFVQMPGASAKEVEERVTKPMEKLLWEIPGVEYIYSTSSPGVSLAIVRFYVGQSAEDAIVRLNQKMSSNSDRIPPGASQPLIKPRSIDDVPILALTLHSKRYGDYELRRVAAQLHDAVTQVDQVSAVELIGGQRRRVLVQLDESRLAGFGLAATEVGGMLARANQSLDAGAFDAGNRRILLEAGQFLTTTEDVKSVVVGVHDGRPVYLRDVAEVRDEGEEPTQHVAYASQRDGGFEPAVNLSISKRQGANAIDVADRVLEKVEAFRERSVPSDISISVTRNYGETAREKSDELLLHMFIAIVAVSALIWLTLGFRESLVVFLAIPTTLAPTLAVFYLLGYTLNRITLFALIFSIGILVDDAIVVVENIARHARLPQNRGRPMSQVAVEAVAEVGNPSILATLAVIAAVLPMAFVSGLMGPYMRPIPVGASAAMVFSVLVAFIVTPWAAIRLLGGGERHEEEQETWSTRLYRRIMNPLLHKPALRYGFLGGVVVLLLASMSLVYIRFVEVKMLPFDNKSEFQSIVDMPEGTTLEETARVTRALAGRVLEEPEVVDVQTYVGGASPYNFNGLVRHYYLRRAAHEADIQVNLLNKHERDQQSHDIAKRVREAIGPLAVEMGANIKVAEVPPGPPVLQTLVAEIYGPEAAGRQRIAGEVLKIFEATPGIVDADWYVEADQPKLHFTVDRQKAALNGISDADIAESLSLAAVGINAGLLHDPQEKEDVAIEVRLNRAARSDPRRLEQLKIRTRSGALAPLSEFVFAEQMIEDKSIYHKNLMPVTYVTADVAGAIESPVYAMLEVQPRVDEIATGGDYKIEQYTASLPFNDDRYSLKWDGEWHITYEVFRDLGLAFAVVMILIYVLVVGWFQSFVTPLVIMSAIPFSLVGILPAHGLLGAFFTATSMIGFIAGAGIVVRNSIILVDFVELRRRQGMPLDEAVVEAGAIRFRPMMLTAAAVVVGASVILFDPIFQGLAIALMAGEVASLLLSRMTVPVVYYLAERRKSR
ncbi:MAG: efflux RND transporter permease subunit [Acidobacteria bacterium]|nr:efflux RND transporter permease subunit [Acidobacteriota bacterium]MDA1233309.1 efflux RND transporter permease subunit [Acidobacteriota bacterium]